MTVRPIFAALLAATAGFVFVSTREVAAQGAPVTVLVSNGMKAAIEELQPQCERAIARPLALLSKHYPNSAELIDQAVAKSGRSADQLKFMPIISLRGDWSILLDAQTGEAVSFVPLEGFF